MEGKDEGEARPQSQFPVTTDQVKVESSPGTVYCMLPNLEWALMGRLASQRFRCGRQLRCDRGARRAEEDAAAGLRLLAEMVLIER